MTEAMILVLKGGEGKPILKNINRYTYTIIESSFLFYYINTIWTFNWNSMYYTWEQSMLNSPVLVLQGLPTAPKKTQFLFGIIMC